MDMELTMLKEFLSKYVNFSTEELEAMFSCVEIKAFKKHEVFIHKGQIANQIAFSLEGYFRAYILHDGEEITRDLTPLHSFFTALPSFSGKTPSFEIFEAINPAKVLLINRSDLYHLYDTYPNWERFGRLVIEEMFINVQYRLYLFITQTAEERYRNFLKNFPDMLQTIPLQYIASFFGIKQQSLSRLRKQFR